ncbi:MAG: DNA repair protein RecO [Mariprofundaceae bacterium]
MSAVSDQGMLLRRIAYGETSLIVHVLTSGHGRLSLMARGARRKNSDFRGMLEPLSLLKLSWRTGRTGMGTLTSIERENLLVPETHMYAGLDLNAIASGLFKEGSPDGFDELVFAFQLLKCRPEDSGLLAAAWFLLHKSGWVGDLDQCWSCGKSDNPMRWSNAQLHCSVCGQGISVSLGLLRGILGHLNSPRVSLPEHDLDTWLAMTQEVLRMHGLRPLSAFNLLL